MSAGLHHNRLLSRTAGVCAVGAGVVSLLGGITWWVPGPGGIAWGSDYVPMAPSTALLMLLLSGAALLHARPAPGRGALGVELTGAALVLAGGLLLGWSQPLRATALAELWLSRTVETVGGIPVGRMSPWTAWCFVASAAALLCRRAERRVGFLVGAASGWLGLGVLGFSGMVVASYLAGTPFFYGSRTIPMAWPTGLAFLLVGGSVLVGGGREAWPLRMFVRPLVPGRPPTHLRFEWLFLGLFLAVAVGILLAGARYLDHLQRLVRDNAQQGLQAVGELKVQQIVQWRSERLADAQWIRDTPSAVRRFLEVLAQLETPASPPSLPGWLDRLLSNGPYTQALLLDAALNPRLVHPPHPRPERSEAVRAAADEALRTGLVTVADLERTTNGGPVRMGFAVPLRAGGEGLGDGAIQAGTGPAGERAGVLVLQVDAGMFLYSLLRTWPTPSPSAETLLVRREGSEVLFLNELRHQPGAALALRRPAGDARLPAARGLRGEWGVREGIDYRGVPVVAAVFPVPESPWVMVAKVDEAELYDPVRRQALSVIALAFALLVAAALGVTVLWRRRNEDFLCAQLAAERERRGLAERFEHLMRSAGEAILLADEENRIVEANDHAVALYGYELAELRAMKLADLEVVPPGEGAPGTAASRGTTRPNPPKIRHRRRDGSSFPVDVNRRLIEIDGVRYTLAILRDITQRQAHEEEIDRLNRLYATLSQVNQTIVRCESREELCTDICRVAIEFGRFQTAWIGWQETVKGPLRTVARRRDGGEPAPGEAVCEGGCGLVAEAMATGRPCLCPQTQADPRVAAGCGGLQAGLPIRSFAVFPVRLAGEVRGAFGLGSAESGFFNAGEVRLLEEVASDLSLALDKFEREAQRLAAEQELIRFNRASAGRELRMIELKEQVNELCRQLNRPPRYPTPPEAAGEIEGGGGAGLAQASKCP